MTDNETGQVAPRMIPGPHGRIAAVTEEGDGPAVVWLGGYASDMRGSKAEAIAAWARERGRACVRFDYSGHGESEGAFEDGCIGDWLADARAALDALTAGPVVLCGSSMGAWIAGLLVREVPERVAGMLLLAPAPDFTQDLTRKGWSKEEQDRLARDGRIAFPSAYDDSEMVYTQRLFDDGAEHLILHEPLLVPCPVRIIQGTADNAVPWTHAVWYAEHMEAEDVTVTLVKGADHRLSTPPDIERMLGVLEAF